MNTDRGVTFEAVAGDPTAYDPVLLAQRDLSNVRSGMNADEVRISPDNIRIMNDLSKDVGKMVFSADEMLRSDSLTVREIISARARERANSGGKGAYPAIQAAKMYQ